MSVNNSNINIVDQYLANPEGKAIGIDPNRPGTLTIRPFQKFDHQRNINLSTETRTVNIAIKTSPTYDTRVKECILKAFATAAPGLEGITQDRVRSWGQLQSASQALSREIISTQAKPAQSFFWTALKTAIQSLKTLFNKTPPMPSPQFFDRGFSEASDEFSSLAEETPSTPEFDRWNTHKVFIQDANKRMESLIAQGKDLSDKLLNFEGSFHDACLLLKDHAQFNKLIKQENLFTEQAADIRDSLMCSIGEQITTETTDWQLTRMPQGILHTLDQMTRLLENNMNTNIKESWLSTLESVRKKIPNENGHKVSYETIFEWKNDTLTTRKRNDGWFSKDSVEHLQTIGNRGLWCDSKSKNSIEKLINLIKNLEPRTEELKETINTLRSLLDDVSGFSEKR